MLSRIIEVSEHVLHKRGNSSEVRSEARGWDTVFLWPIIEREMWAGLELWFCHSGLLTPSFLLHPISHDIDLSTKAYYCQILLKGTFEVQNATIFGHV